MLYIFTLACTTQAMLSSARMNNMRQYDNFGKDHAAEVKLGLCNSICRTEHGQQILWQ